MGCSRGGAAVGGGGRTPESPPCSWLQTSGHSWAQEAWQPASWTCRQARAPPGPPPRAGRRGPRQRSLPAADARHQGSQLVHKPHEAPLRSMHMSQGVRGLPWLASRACSAGPAAPAASVVLAAPGEEGLSWRGQRQAAVQHPGRLCGPQGRLQRRHAGSSCEQLPAAAAWPGRAPRTAARQGGQTDQPAALSRRPDTRPGPARGGQEPARAPYRGAPSAEEPAGGCIRPCPGLWAAPGGVWARWQWPASARSAVRECLLAESQRRWGQPAGLGRPAQPLPEQSGQLQALVAPAGQQAALGVHAGVATGRRRGWPGMHLQAALHRRGRRATRQQAIGGVHHRGLALRTSAPARPAGMGGQRAGPASHTGRAALPASLCTMAHSAARGVHATHWCTTRALHGVTREVALERSHANHGLTPTP